MVRRRGRTSVPGEGMRGLTGSSSADPDQAIWVTLWISGTVATERIAVDEGLESVITRVTRLLMAQCVTDGARFRILTTAASNGLEGEFERAVARIAQREGLPLHLIAPGLPAPLAPAQAAAQRQVWLGAEQEHLESGEPYRLSREIALGFSDLVLCVGGLTPELAKIPQTLSQFGTVSAAALAMKPVTSLHRPLRLMRVSTPPTSTPRLRRASTAAPYGSAPRRPPWQYSRLWPVPSGSGQGRAECSGPSQRSFWWLW